MKKSGFTLIELLVVIAIIAILAGIALPVFNKVQEKSRATNCANNLRQVGLGIQGYLNDNEDQMFAAPAPEGGGGGEVTPWPGALNPRYVQSWKVFRSPFDKETAARPSTESAAGPVPVSYGVNQNVLGKNSSDFAAPSQLIVAAPAPSPGPELAFAGTSVVPTPLTVPAGGGAAKGGTHNGRSQLNALYADSHVANLTWREFSNSSDEEGMKRWFPEGKKP